MKDVNDILGDLTHELEIRKGFKREITSPFMVGYRLAIDHAIELVKVFRDYLTPKKEISFTIDGVPRTKKNSQIIAGSGRRCPVCGKFSRQWIKQSAAHDEWKSAALWQIKTKRPPKPLTEAVNIKAVFYMPTRGRVDRLNLLAAVDDLLVEAGFIKDDNSAIVTGHDGSRVLYDPERPRIELTISVL